MTDDDLPDLLAWRVPPPPPLDSSSLVMRALQPATAPVRRPRLRWLVASLVLFNAAIAAVLIIVLARPPAPPPAVVAVPAGGGSTDARVHELLARLADEQAQLEKKLAELEQLRALVLELSDKVARCEQQEHTVVRPPGPAPVIVHPPTPAPVPTTPQVVESCDEVSCVLNDYPSGCCDKYKNPIVLPPPPGLPDSLDRVAISSGIASVKATVASCETPRTAKGTVKIHVRVGADGLVTNVDVVATPDAALGGCVARAVQRAVFPRTRQGGTFSYPFVF